MDLNRFESKTVELGDKILSYFIFSPIY